MDDTVKGPRLRWFRVDCIMLSLYHFAMNAYQNLSELQTLTGSILGTSDWFHIDRARIDQFAAVTGDDQWIHVDPVGAGAVRCDGGPRSFDAQFAARDGKDRVQDCRCAHDGQLRPQSRAVSGARAGGK